MSEMLPIAGPRPAPDATGRRNMLLLVQLRWIAVLGQLITILVVRFPMDVPLPLAPMLAVIAALVLLNIASLATLRRDDIGNTALLIVLLLDFAALSIQLYLSGGATNPFVSLYLLQVVLGAVLLETWSSWALVALTSVSFATLALFHRPLALPPRFASQLSDLQIIGIWLNFVLAAVLLVLFVTRIANNLRRRDARLAEMRQHAAEEDHIVRMGLLASGAAHELGTPLASLAVILGDWKHMPALAEAPDLLAEIDEMQAEIARCKAIVTGILLAAGEARGESPVRTTMRQFLRHVVAEWQANHPQLLVFDDRFGPDIAIVSDPALKQVFGNILDNAAEAGAATIAFNAARADEALTIDIADDGPGFAPDMLAALGKPYQSTKPRLGGGLGLFLGVNVMRKLGGTITARNTRRGAIVSLRLPLAGIAIDG